jgi:hypothetical protein
MNIGSSMKRSLRNYAVIVTTVGVIIGIGILLLCVVMVIRGKKSTEYAITLGQQGFSPRKIVVPYHSTIVFQTTRNEPYWPASDVHPSHRIYPQFDAKKPIDPDKRWKFVSDKPGVWTYHDHLHPEMRGSISVQDEHLIATFIRLVQSFYFRLIEIRTAEHFESIATRCKSIDTSISMMCWNTYFSDVLREVGVKETILILKQFLDRGMIGYRDCHNVADEIGIASYWRYADGERFPFTHDTGICYGGFFHGFMAEHVSHGRQRNASKELCDRLGPSEQEMVRDCYVGLGGGLVYYYWNNNLVGTIAQSIAWCDSLSTRKEDCAYGVFGGLEHLYRGAHGPPVAVDTEDPFLVCNAQQNNLYKGYCVERVIPPLFDALNHDVSTISHWVQRIFPISLRGSMATIIGHTLFQQQFVGSTYDTKLPLAECKKFLDELSLDCAQGVFYDVFYTIQGWGRDLDSVDCEDSSYSLQEQHVCKDQKNTVRLTNQINE